MTESDKTCCPTHNGAAASTYEPTGKDFYITGPMDAKAGVLIVGDIFGALPNSKRFADVLASKGYLAVVPDFFGDKAWDENSWPPNFESPEWQAFYKHITDMDLHAPTARRGIELLRKMGCTKIGTMGNCWGTGIALRMGAEGLADAVAAAHPSFLTPDAIDTVINLPVMILPSKDEANMDVIEVAMKKNTNCTVFKTYDKLPHGFLANRYDWTHWDAEQRSQFEDAVETALNFYEKVLA